MPALQGRWCPSCGAGTDLDALVCPHCGMPLGQEWTVGEDAANGPALQDTPPDEEPAIDEKADTRAIPRIESAIPPEDDPQSKVVAHEGVPRTAAFVLSAIASIVVVGGITLAITHPWDPTVHSIGATTEADTSVAGFPGTVETLSGQDSGAIIYDAMAADDETYAVLLEAHDKLLRYAQRADENDALFAAVAFTDDLDARMRGKREADLLAIDINNLTETLTQQGAATGPYAEDREHLLTLAQWQRLRVDALTQAWKEDVASASPQDERDRIVQPLVADLNESGTNTYKALFDQSWEPWRPQRKDPPAQTPPEAPTDEAAQEEPSDETSAEAE